jgi:hypothetical protein
MRLSRDSTKLDYAPRRGRVTPEALRKWGWFGIVGGMLGDALGLLCLLHLQGRPAAEIHWAVAALVAVLLMGGFAVLLAGIILLAIAPSRPG